MGGFLPGVGFDIFHFHFSRRWDTISLSFFDACMHGQDSTFTHETPVRRLNAMALPSQLFCLAGIYTSLLCVLGLTRRHWHWHWHGLHLYVLVQYTSLDTQCVISTTNTLPASCVVEPHIGTSKS
ncbi:hypothetical protein BJX66DRAFT_158913 [Aspergillus keveii]|uniref:Uncharacterized protein n=1 Tax=Aspergillus keveii TaxID=714993 RepID=A0ABR4GA13_9EURO